MPRKNLFTKQEIIDVAICLVREEGYSALTARTLGKRLGTSSQPIFGHFGSMGELQEAVLQEAMRIHKEYLFNSMTHQTKYPPYKAAGMAYIEFAKVDQELFKLLFMKKCPIDKDELVNDELEVLIDVICKQVAITKEQAKMFYLEMWTYSHGIATMIATGYYAWDEELISRSMTDMYLGLKQRYESLNANPQ